MSRSALRNTCARWSAVLVYRAKTDCEKLTCLESDKLSGTWLTPHELTVLYGENKLESWSRIVYDALLKEEMR